MHQRRITSRIAIAVGLLAAGCLPGGIAIWRERLQRTGTCGGRTIEAIGVLCDSDNTRDQVVAEFGELECEAEPRTAANL